MKHYILTPEQELQVYRLLELRRELTDKKLMQRFKCGAQVLRRIRIEGPRDAVPRETTKKLSFEQALVELGL
jgi:hypothetical protein